MATKEYLNFGEISSQISFEEVLNWLNIPYQKKGKELKGEGFIVSIEKNQFFSPKDETVKGSVINFVAENKKIDLREAASLLKKEFLTNHKPSATKRDIPHLQLDYDSYLQERGITPAIAKEYEVGYVKQRSIIANRIGVKVYSTEEELIGYVAYNKEENTWFFPKGFKRPIYNFHRVKETSGIVVTTDPFDALRIISLGFTKVVSLLAKSMTTEQEKQLRHFTYILLLHPEPHNITLRLSTFCFVKAPVLSKPLAEHTDEEIMKFIKPS